MKYEFHPEALDEYQQAALWYAERDQSVALRSLPLLKTPSSEL